MVSVGVSKVSTGTLVSIGYGPISYSMTTYYLLLQLFSTFSSLIDDDMSLWDLELRSSVKQVQPTKFKLELKELEVFESLFGSINARNYLAN